MEVSQTNQQLIRKVASTPLALIVHGLIGVIA